MDRDRKNMDWRAAGGGSEKSARKQKWQNDELVSSAVDRPRKAKLWLLSLGGLATLAGIYLLILLLTPPNRPGLIAIGADPEVAAANLRVPYDPYGWKSGLRLIEWSKKIDKKVLKTLGDKPYSLDKELDQWVEMVASGNVNPVIIYVGLHGGVDQNGNPVLYSGSNNSPFPLADVLDKLNEKAASKHIVLVLDTGRSLPDPNLGELSNDFSHAVKEKLGKRIAESKQLSVILSASDGQRAWDSPDLGMTSLAYHLAKSLVGTAGSKYWDSFSLLDLYETLERSVSTWSQNNRPTNQDIQLIPDKSEWLSDPKRSNTKNWSFFRMTDPEEIANPSRAQASEELIQTWKECDELGSQQRRVPANVYTPANWRRYRELLLRYELAVTSGDQAGEAVIKNALNEAKVIIERGLDLKLNSQGYSIPLFASLGNPNDKLQIAVSQLDQQPSLTAANDIIKTAMSGNSQTPVEFHLPIMLSNFNNQILKVGNEENGPFVSNWKQAVRTRRMAEQAACSFSDGFPYSEYVWPVIRSEVLAGDLLRRQGEDRIHIVQKKNDEHDKAAKQFFDMAEKKYRSALETAKRLQSALRTCNDALADLPFLSRWITESDLELSNPGSLVEMNEKLIEALKLTNQLSSKLIAEKGTFLVNDDLDKATKSVEVAMTTLRNALEKSIIMPYESDTNENWLRIERLLLLPSPIIKEENRKQLYNRWRQISAQKPQNQDAETNRKQTIIVTQEQKIARRLAAATESLDGPFGKWSKFSPLTLQFDSKEKYAIAAYLSVQKQLEANFEKQSSEGVSGSLSEMISRSAVPSLKLDQEPAMQEARIRWKAFLEGMAARIALDHWYNQNGNSYFAQTIAGEMLSDAKKLGDRDKLGEDGQLAEKIGKLGALNLHWDTSKNEYRWSSEANRKLGFTVESYGVPGEATIWSQSTVPAVLDVNRKMREGLDLSKKYTDSVLVNSIENDVDVNRDVQKVQIEMNGYFRGQARTQQANFRVNRQPDLVVTDVPPTRNALLAIRADADFDPGAVAFLLDYSGSMTDRWGGENGPIKKEAMINALQSILLKLPRNTVVSIRVLIGNKEYTDRDGTRLIFPNKEFPEKNFRDLVTESGGPLIDILKGRGEGKNNTMFPDGATPLLPLMKKTIDEDFPKGYEGVKTLVVLTDGADTTWFSQIFGNVEFKAKEVKKESGKRDKLIDDVHKDLKRNLSESGVSIQFLIFGADEDETTLAEEMFKPIENHDAPGQIYRPENISDLKQKLESSLRPKPRLLKNGNPIPNSPDERKYLPSSGIPVNHISQGPGGIKWWGYIAPDNLTLSYGIQQKVNFSKSDCLMLKMIRNGQNKIAFQREIYYKDVDKSIPRNRIDENDDWFLAVPEYGRRNESFTNFLLATATLDEKRTVSVDPSFPLSQINPRFAWWEFNRSVAGKIERFPGTVYVRNSPGLYAPAWRIIGDVGGNFTNELRDSTYSIRGWAQRDILPSIPNLSISFKPNEYASRTYESKVKDGITVRVSLEDIRFMKDPPVDAGRLPADVTAEKKRCLVVRIEDEAGRILQAQIPSMRDLIREHRYYYEKDNGVANGVRPKVASYTGIFGPVNIDALNQQIEIEVVSISQAIADNDQIKSVKVDLGSPPDSSTQLLPPDPQKPPK